VTITVAVPEALLNAGILAESGEYLPVRVLEPVASEPAAIVRLAEPELSVAAEEV